MGAIDQQEADASTRMESELQAALKTARAAEELVHEALCAASKPDEPVEIDISQEIAFNLLLRIQNDLRCAELLALRGYPLQSIALVASLLESALTVAVIGSDNGEARRWKEHTDEKRTFMSVPQMIAKLRRDNKIRQEGADELPLVYRKLCMAKHANPIVQEIHGAQIEQDVRVFDAGPDITDRAQCAAWRSLQEGARLTRFAVKAFIGSHQVPSTNALRARLGEMESAYCKAEDLFRQRWSAASDK